MIVFSGEMLTFNTFSSSFAADEDFVVHRNNPPIGLSFRAGGFTAGPLFSFPVLAPSVPATVDPTGTVPHSELGGLDLLDENRLLGLKIASNFSTAGEYVLPPLPMPLCPAVSVAEEPLLLSATFG